MTTTLTVDQAFSLFEAAKNSVREAQIAESKALDILVAAAGGNKTFSHKGQLYQVRSRLNKELGITLNFICQLKTEPKEWLSAAREARMSTPVDNTPVEVSESAVAAVEDTLSQAAAIKAQLAEQFATGAGDPQLPSEKRKLAVSTADMFDADADPTVGGTVLDDGTVTLE